MKDAFTPPGAAAVYPRRHALGAWPTIRIASPTPSSIWSACTAIDDGTVGTEARLIAAKALMKLEKPADAATVLEPATSLGGGAAAARSWVWPWRTSSPAREDDARSAALDGGAGRQPALRQGAAGPHPPPRRNVAGSQPGSIEEALVYSQTYGDVWTEDAKAFLETVLEERGAQKAALPAPAPPDEATAPA